MHQALNILGKIPCWWLLKFLFSLPRHLRSFQGSFYLFPGQNVTKFKDIPRQNWKIEEIHKNIRLIISSKSKESGTYHKKHKNKNQIFNYLKEINCLRDKFSRFSRLFVKFSDKLRLIFQHFAYRYLLYHNHE